MLSSVRTSTHVASLTKNKTFYSAVAASLTSSTESSSEGHIDSNHSILYALDNLSRNNTNSLNFRYPDPPPAKSNYQNRITRHSMDSKYLTNLFNYKPIYFENQKKFSIWHKLPVCRRSAVMVLLFLGNDGELRVILTKRSKQLRNFSGHVSFPGGKADNGLESEFQCARREMEEEIGISRHNSFLLKQYGFVIDELMTLPAYLARTFLAVAPCIGYINWKEDIHLKDRWLRDLVLNPGESSSIFSVPLRDFLQPKTKNFHLKECLKQSHIKTKWAGLPWNLRSFIFPLHNPCEVSWLQEVEDLSPPTSEDETHEDQEFDVRTRNCWGLTANILHDIAEVIYNGGKQVNVIGEEDLIHELYNNGQMQSKDRTDFEKKIINNFKGATFNEVIPDEKFQKLKNLYNH